MTRITPSDLRAQANDLRNCAQLPRMHRDTQWEIDAAVMALERAAEAIEALASESARFRAALFSSHANLPLPDGELMAALGPKDSGAKP